MKRLHVHVSVKDLAASIRFYRTLFGAEPAVTKADYAKWMLEDPRVNFAIWASLPPGERSGKRRPRNTTGIDAFCCWSDFSRCAECRWKLAPANAWR